MTRRIHLIALAAAVAAGCTDNRSSVSILARAAPDSIPSCKFAAGGTALPGAGQLDLSAGSPKTYEAFFYVNSALVDPSKADTSKVASSKAWRALAAKVRINPSDYLSSFPPSPNLLGFSIEGRMPLDGFTLPAEGTGVVNAPLVSFAMGDALDKALGTVLLGQVVVGVTLEGQTLDGASLDTGEYYFPINLCRGTGCLYPRCKPTERLGGCVTDPPYQDPVDCVPGT